MRGFFSLAEDMGRADPFMEEPGPGPAIAEVDILDN